MLLPAISTNYLSLRMKSIFEAAISTNVDHVGASFSPAYMPRLVPERVEMLGVQDKLFPTTALLRNRPVVVANISLQGSLYRISTSLQLLYSVF